MEGGTVFLCQTRKLCRLAATPKQSSVFISTASLALLSFFPSSLIVFIPQLPLARSVSEAHPFQSQTTGAGYTAPGEGRWFDSHVTPSVCLAAASREQVEKGFAQRERDTHARTDTHTIGISARWASAHIFPICIRDFGIRSMFSSTDAETVLSLRRDQAQKQQHARGIIYCNNANG